MRETTGLTDLGPGPMWSVMGSREEERDATSEHGAYMLEDGWGQATFLTTRCFVHQVGLELKSSLFHPLEHLSTVMDYHGQT